MATKRVGTKAKDRVATMADLQQFAAGIESVFTMFDQALGEMESRLRALEPRPAGARFDATGKVIADDVPMTTAAPEAPKPTLVDRGGFSMPVSSEIEC